MIKNFAATSFLVLLYLLCGCKPLVIYQDTVDKHNYVLAEAQGNYKLTLPDFYQKLSGSDILKNGGILDKNAVSKLVDSILVDTLIGLRAEKVNLRENYEYYFRHRENCVRTLVEAYYQHAIFNNITVDSQEAVDYFNTHPDDFKMEEQVLVYHIVITTYGLLKSKDSLIYKAMTKEKLEDTSRIISETLRGMINSKETFMEVAKQYSHDDFTGKRGGLVNWAPKGFYNWPFDSLAFAAKPGDFVGPYRDKDGWQILYIDQHIPAGAPPLNPELYAAAKTKVQNEKSRQISFSVFDSLFHNIKIDYNEALYDSNAYSIDKRIWAAVVNGIDTIDFGELSSGEEQLREKNKVTNSTAAMKKDLAKFLARRWVLVQTARKMGLDTLPDVKKDIYNSRHYFSRIIVENSKEDPNWEPTEAEMRKYYDANQDKYVVAKPLKVQQILVKDSSLAEFVSDQASSGADFLELADEFYVGEKSIRRDLANLGYIGPNDVSPEFFEAARSTRTGEVSKPVKTKFGYHIIKVLESKWSVPFENAQSDIRKALGDKHESERAVEFKNGLFQEFNIVKRGQVYSIHLKPQAERQNAS